MSSQTYVAIAIWSQVLSSVVFIAALLYLWLRYVQPVVLAARERSNRQIAEAERRRDDAKAALEALRNEIDGAKNDAALILERAARQAEFERRSAIAEATESGERVVRNARGELERSRAAARERLRGELVKRALETTRTIAADRIDALANERLIRAFLSSLESGRVEGRPA